jgi:hypothetical protein
MGVIYEDEKKIRLRDACTEYEYDKETGTLDIKPKKCDLNYKPDDPLELRMKLLEIAKDMVEKGGKQRIIFEQE